MLPPDRAWGIAMHESTHDVAPADDEILTFNVADAVLEKAANAFPGAAMSFPNAPTVSILFVCCGND
jgi:hypothetical protein